MAQYDKKSQVVPEKRAGEFARDFNLISAFVFGFAQIDCCENGGNGEPDSIEGNISAWANPKQKTLLALN